MDWDGGQFKGPLAFWIALALLSFLQVLNLIWLGYIVRIAWRMAVHNIVEDERSDDEDDEPEAVEGKAEDKAGVVTNGDTKVANGTNGAKATNGKTKR